MEIEKIIKKGYETYEFPLDEFEIDSILKKLPLEDIQGLESVIITPPIKNKDFERFGRYKPLSNKRGLIYLFMHMKRNDEFIIQFGHRTLKYSLREFRTLAGLAVLHEVGHHVGIKNFQDYSESFTDNYKVKYSFLLNKISTGNFYKNSL